MPPRKFLAAPMICVIIGLIGFGNVSRSPRFASFQTVDVVQLIATGMCFGVALAALVAALRLAARKRLPGA
jgi:hypothetical protein